MSKNTELRFTENFLSSQGEGLYVGTPSVFLRTFGCNFRCKEFGLPTGSVTGNHNPEVKNLINSGVIESTNRFDDLPLVHTGCDTYASIYPEFKKFARTGTPEQIAQLLVDTTPTGRWILPTRQDIHLILTGGEPMLWQGFWMNLFRNELMRPIRNVTIETNGTQEISADFLNFLNSMQFTVTWSCSPKLSHSGEARSKAIRPNTVSEYMRVNRSQMYLKFVVTDQNDLEEVTQTVHEYIDAGVQCPVYLMPTGGCIEEYRQNERIVADLALEHGWRFSPRMQINLYGNQWGT